MSDERIKKEHLSECPLCESRVGASEVLQARDHLITGKLYKVVRCLTCDFLYTNPRPTIEDSINHYRSDDYISHTDSKHGLRDRMYQAIKQHMLKKKLRVIQRAAQRHRKNAHADKPLELLDFGCGSGEFVLASQKAGHQSVGYEPDQMAAMKVKQKGARVLDKQDDLDAIQDHSFDVITLWHALEHVHELGQCMKELRRLLSDTGLLVIAAPMVNSTDAEYYKRFWAAYDLPRHLYHFNPSSLLQLGRNFGFELIRRHALPFDSYYISLLSESYKEQETNKQEANLKSRPGLPALLRALWMASWSNLRAATSSKPWSSEIFLFRLKQA